MTLLSANQNAYIFRANDNILYFLCAALFLKLENFITSVELKNNSTTKSAGYVSLHLKSNPCL